jgi:hypothetical protein
MLSTRPEKSTVTYSKLNSGRKTNKDKARMIGNGKNAGKGRN